MANNIKITKIEMPSASEWGIVQINNLDKTYFRFELVDGRPKLDTSFFADGVENPNEKHRDFSGELYKTIQHLLEDYFDNVS